MRQGENTQVVTTDRDTPPADLQWGNVSADSLLAHIVVADTLYLLYFMEEVSARLGWAWSRAR